MSHCQLLKGTPLFPGEGWSRGSVVEYKNTTVVVEVGFHSPGFQQNELSKMENFQTLQEVNGLQNFQVEWDVWGQL